MTIFILTCYAMFIVYTREACSFPKGNGGRMDLGDRRGEGEAGREGGEGNCS